MASVLSLKEASTIAKYIGAYQRNKPVWIGLHDPQKVTDLAHRWPLGRSRQTVPVWETAPGPLTRAHTADLQAPASS